MKTAVLIYHKNADTIYPKEWIDEFRNSILNQSYTEFDIVEMNYGGGEHRIFDGYFYRNTTDNFVDAMNKLFEFCKKGKYDYVFNTNVDDFYAVTRLEKQIEYLEKGYDVVSSNFMNIYDSGEWKPLRFHEKDIKSELALGHNIICHPCVAYSSKFINTHRYNSTEIPYEDLKLWQRVYKDNNMIILEDILCFHRIHDNSVCRSDNR